MKYQVLLLLMFSFNIVLSIQEEINDQDKRKFFACLLISKSRQEKDSKLFENLFKDYKFEEEEFKETRTNVIKRGLLNCYQKITLNKTEEIIDLNENKKDIDSMSEEFVKLLNFEDFENFLHLKEKAQLNNEVKNLEGKITDLKKELADTKKRSEYYQKTNNSNSESNENDKSNENNSNDKLNQGNNEFIDHDKILSIGISSGIIILILILILYLVKRFLYRNEDPEETDKKNN